jgi:hypothetical protein
MGDRICAWIAEGKTLYSFCLQEGTPNITTVYDWRRAQPDFDKNYARARDDGWDVFAEKLIERSIDVPAELAQSRRLEVDAGKWYLSKVAARRYGDRIDVKQEISGLGGGPIQIQALLGLIENPAVMEKLTELQIEAIRSAALALAAPGGAPTIEGECSEVSEPDGGGDA